MKTISLIAAVLLSVCLFGAQVKPVTERPTQTAGSAHVEVYVTPKGKTYHTYRDCIGVSRSHSVLTASEADAQQHGLTLCGICAHRHHAGAGATNESWAKPEVKK